MHLRTVAGAFWDPVVMLITAGLHAIDAKDRLEGGTLAFSKMRPDSARIGQTDKLSIH